MASFRVTMDADIGIHMCGSRGAPIFSTVSEAQASMAGVRAVGVPGREELDCPLSLMTKARLSLRWKPEPVGVDGVTGLRMELW